jgi:hypothetical protein
MGDVATEMDVLNDSSREQKRARTDDLALEMQVTDSDVLPEMEPLTDRMQRVHRRRLVTSASIDQAHERTLADLFSLKPQNEGEKDIPRSIIMMNLFVGMNALSQCVGDIIIESLMFAGKIPAIEFRVSFVCLTLLSALLGAHAIDDIKDNQLVVFIVTPEALLHANRCAGHNRASDARGPDGGVWTVG